ncbi:methyl-accepting chemotaxis protein [uncultured Sphingomonas sp.]|uniref:methyl-accepting chemotaxis protein n=1 Tax=uncultured Sphingomonas sp. TaxID=158754 RepID=UPI0025D0897D|nr:methyl-accepting chemotaxis protein [uncultured Sphingomonas sp.]
MSRRIWTICAVLLTVSVLTALFGFTASRKLSSAQEQTLVAATALRNHVEADMMHDALRADVLSALYAAATGDRRALTRTQEDLAEHGLWFRRVVEGNRALPLGDAAQAALAKVGEPLDAYTRHAARMVELAGNDYPSARRELPRFLRDLERLEGVMEATSDQLEAAMKEDQASVARWSAAWTLSLVLSLAAGLGSAAWVTGMLRRDIVLPIGSLTRSLHMLTAGELHAVVEGTDRGDEIGALAKGLARYKEAVAAAQVAEIDKQRATQEFQDQTAKRDNAAATERQVRQAMADQLEQRVLKVVAQVASASEALGRAADEMKQSALGTKSDVGAAVNATEEAAGNVAIVGSAADELAMSIAEISEQSESSASAARTMAQRATAVAEQMTELEGATARIAHVSGLINDVAQRTNLLALNATIEAARAGASGAGFAVVASEIRSLAEQTTASTSEIGAQIGSVLRTATQVAGAVREVEDAVGEVELATTSISTAVEQQSKATDEINHSMQRTVTSTEALRHSMGGVERQASATEMVAKTVGHAAVTLDAHAGDLKREVMNLITQIRSAA